MLEHSIREEGKGEGDSNQYDVVAISHINNINSEQPSPTEAGYYEVVSVPHPHTKKPATAIAEGGGAEEASYEAVCASQ